MDILWENVLPACQCTQTIGAGGKIVSKNKSRDIVDNFHKDCLNSRSNLSCKWGKTCSEPMSTWGTTCECWHYHKLAFTKVIFSWGDKATMWHLKSALPPFHPSQTPHCHPTWTNTGMGSNLTANGTIECDVSITVWCCWGCARCKGSYPCSQKFAMNTWTLCERELALSSTPHTHTPRKVENTMFAKTCWMRNNWFLQQTRLTVSHAGCISINLHQ